MAVKFGTFVPQGWKMDLVGIADPVAQYEAMTRVAQEAERLGFDSIWVYYHFHTVPTPVLETVFECWSITAGLARDTSRIRRRPTVTSNGSPPPRRVAYNAATGALMGHARPHRGRCVPHTPAPIPAAAAG